MIELRIKNLGGLERPLMVGLGDWVDIAVPEDIEMKAGEYKEIPLGIALELPKGCEAIMAPRSSTFRKYGIILTGSIGVIDEAYNGDDDEWKFPAYATRDTKICKGDRICQFRTFAHQGDVMLHYVDSLNNASRGGLGSTGQ